MKLRPHHLLCTQSFRGKGYDDDFVENMTLITDCLRGDESVCIDLVFSTDDICEKCPRLVGNDQCADNDKVKLFDKKVADYFCLKEKTYTYQNIVREINALMTAEVMDDICGDCSWYSMCACRSVILKNAHE